MTPKPVSLAGIALATAAAGLFACTTAVQGPERSEARIDCFGVNACKAQGECRTPWRSCNSMNSCKGKGYLKLTAAECDARGGTPG